jgi:myo-inositol-1(or 4)-monophosphatase/deoxyribonuclease-2
LDKAAQVTLTTAHRGDSARHRENTVAAIHSAIEHGADIVEIDIRESSDGQLIVLHDQSLERLWGYPVAASQVEWAEIEQLGFGQYKIPTLVAVINLFSGSEADLMIDMDTPIHALAAIALVESSSLAPERVIWCGNLEAMRLIRSHSRTARIWLPWNEAATVDPLLLSEIEPEFVNSHYSYWNQERVAALHALGLKASAWTIDDAPTMRWAKAIGIDSITSNNLALLQEVLAEEGEIDPLNLDRAFDLATSIGKWAIMICQMMSPGEIKTKVDAADLVTEVDLFIESHLREMIRANFPTHNIVGEEFGGEYLEEVPTWYIDPVDGTTNFANGTPWSSLSLSLAVGRTPLVATTIDPWRNKLFQALAGQGAFINGERITPFKRAEIQNPLAGKVVLTELAGSKPWEGMQEFLEGLHENFCTMRIMGAGTLTLTAVSADYGVGAVVHQFSPIDHLAAALIAKESGCLVLNERGEEDLFPLTGGILIAQPHAGKALFKIWQPS